MCDTSVIFSVVQHLGAINDAYTSSVVFMLHLAEPTANQWV